MPHLSISLLGPFTAELNSQPLRGFRSNKVRALLAYLAVESHRPWSRATLAGLLWPDLPEQSAQSNLRNALSNLRQVTGDARAKLPFLLITEPLSNSIHPPIAASTCANFWISPHPQMPDTALLQVERISPVWNGHFPCTGENSWKVFRWTAHPSKNGS